MILSARLQGVAALVAHPTVADIGTDHGYIPIWLWREGRLSRGIACDVKKGPLSRAAANIAANGAEEAVETRLGDGLRPVAPGEVETAVLAGMGGLLMIRILKDAPEVVKSLRQLVVQPQRDVAEVRRALHELGFAIRQELMLVEEGHYYTILSATPGAETYTDREYRYGKLLLDRKDPYLREYLAVELEKKSKIQQLKTQVTEMREVYEWLSNAGIY